MTRHAAVSTRRLRTEELLSGALREHGPATRAELSRLTGLSRSAIGAGVQVLLADGRIGERTADGRGQRGRPSRQLALVARRGLVVGVDFGHSHVAAALARTSGEVLAERRVEVEVDTEPQRALDAAVAIVAALVAERGVVMAEVLAVAAGIPGPLDLETAYVGSATILGDWSDIDPRSELSSRLGIAVVTGNDANMGAQGELRFGAARPYRDFLYVKASHGIGAGLVLNGRTYGGATGVAGEIGHTQVPGATSWCRCGNRGCLETVVSVSEVRRQLGHVLPPGADLTQLSAVVGTAAAVRVITDAGRTIGRALADLCNCLNPAAIVLGGELGAAGPALVAGVRESVDRYSQPATSAAVKIHTAQLGTRSEVMGAVATAIAQVEPEPAHP